MNQLNQMKICNLLDIIKQNKNVIVYDNVPAPCANIIDEATRLKRNKRYDDAISKYFEAIQLGYFTTEMGRMMCKTLCAMNEYQLAMIVLFFCASVKWEDTVKMDSMYGAVLGQDVLKQFEHEVPTACANDFYILRDAIILAAKGDFKALFDRTKAVSGQNDYQNVKSNSQIQTECKTICDGFGVDIKI